MDINYLLKREQVSLIMASRAVGREAKSAHAGLAHGYGVLLSASAFPHRRLVLPSAKEGGHAQLLDLHAPAEG